MNIFVLDQEPRVAPSMLCDCHVTKMCVETAQIIGGTLNGFNMFMTACYFPKTPNINHPVIKAVNTIESFNWLLLYFSEILDEFKYRRGKPHKYDKEGVRHLINDLYCNYRPYSCEGLYKCCTGMNTDGLDVVTAYKQYYTELKKPQLQNKNLWKFTKREDWT